MTDLRVTLTSTGGTLDLAEISMTGEGVEAVAGATGFGLPPVDVQWVEGVGDGARPVYTRVQPRDIEIPLSIAVPSRAVLKDRLRRMAMVLARPTTMTLIDPDGPDMEIDVVRVGGGEYATGKDTDGQYHWHGVVTLRAGDPFWRWTETRTASRSGAGTLSIDNPGSAQAPARWTVNGPFGKVGIKTPDSTVEWSGQVLAGQSITIDGQAATVVDHAGRNRYAGLGPAPQFGPLEPGVTPATITFAPALVESRVNHFTNPRFASSVADWRNTAIVSTTVTTVASGGRQWLLAGSNSPTPVPNTLLAFKKITGLPPGEQFSVSLDVAWHNVDGFTPATPPRVRLFGAGAEIATQGSFNVPFVVPDSGSLTVELISGRVSGGTPCYARITSLYVGRLGDYFDGSSPTVGTRSYSWEGAVDASRSIESPQPIVGTPSLSCELTPREWLVI